MRKITKQKLEEALVQECLDHVKYLIYAEKAKEEGLANVARLFQTLAYAERIHAKRFLKSLGELGSTRENLARCFENEKYEAEEMYPALFELSGMMNEVEAQIGFHGAQQTESIHAGLLARAQESMDAKKDVIVAEVHICKSCGFTLEGSPPPSCPICGMPKSNFKEF